MGLMDFDSEGLDLVGPELTASTDKGQGPVLVPWDTLQLRIRQREADALSLAYPTPLPAPPQPVPLGPVVPVLLWVLATAGLESVQLQS